MMGPGFADAVGGQLLAIAAALIVLAFSAGLLAMWGIPKVWQWLKPLLHAVTA